MGNGDKFANNVTRVIDLETLLSALTCLVVFLKRWMTDDCAPNRCELVKIRTIHSR